jgi:hypothetical protein
MALPGLRRRAFFWAVGPFDHSLLEKVSVRWASHGRMAIAEDESILFTEAMRAVRIELSIPLFP